jgi:hypothetical protein
MASSKDTFESHTFRAHSFASGLFRGVTVDTSVRDRWANVIRLNTSHGRTTASIDAARLIATIDSDRLDALATGNRSELQADHGRIE